MNTKKIGRIAVFSVRVLAAALFIAACSPGLPAWNTGQVQTEYKEAKDCWGKINGKNAYFDISYVSAMDVEFGMLYHRSAHIYILQRAIDILKNDGYDNWSILLQSNLLHLASGSEHADSYKDRILIRITLEAFWGLVDIDSWDIDLTCAAGCEHYHNPANGQGLDLSTWSIAADAADYLVRMLTMLVAHEITLGLLDVDIDVIPDLRSHYPSGLELCKKHYLDALKAWNGDLQYPRRSVLDSVFYELGWSTHLLGDLSVAQHVHNEFIGGHADYEDAADGLGDTAGFHATSAKGVYLFHKAQGTQAVGQLAAKLANLIHSDPQHHHLAEKGDTAQRHQALKKALPLAEQYTAALMAQFLHEAGVPPTQPPLEGTVRAMNGAKIPHAYLFYAPAGYSVQIEQNLTAAELAKLDPKTNWRGWSYIRADANGRYKLPVKKYQKVWLRPAMPGYSFTGKTPGMEAFTPKQVPILFVPPNVATGKSTMDLYLEPLASSKVDTLAAQPGGFIHAMKTPAASGPAALWIHQPRAEAPLPIHAGLTLPQAKEKLSPALAQAVYHGVAKVECSHSALQTQGGVGILPSEALVTIRISNLVKTSTAEILQSTVQVVAAVDEARCRMQLLEKQLAADPGQLQPLNAPNLPLLDKVAYQKLQGMLPSTTIKEKSGRQRRLYFPAGHLKAEKGGTLLLLNGMALMPAASGVEIEVRADSGPGMLSLGTQPFKLVTGPDGTASFRVRSGSHPGRLLLRFKVTKNPKALDIRPEGTVDILVQPGLDQAEPLLETPVSLGPVITPVQLVVLFPALTIMKTAAAVYHERVPLRRPPDARRAERPERAEEEELRRRGEEEEQRRIREEEERRLRERPPSREVEAAGRLIDIDGEWHSNRGGAYFIEQSGGSFRWERLDVRQEGRGQIRGRELEAEWTGEPESGDARGAVAEADPQGRAQIIEWDNGMVFFRSAPGAEPLPEPPREEERPPEPPPPPHEEERPPEPTPPPHEPERPPEPTPPPPHEPERPPEPTPPPPPREPVRPPEPTPPPPPRIERYDISGTWRSNRGLVYSIRQQGNDFAWQVEGQRQIGQGKINGRSLQASWGGTSPGQAQGQVGEATPQGRALVIRWSNGMVFTR
ncbi:MAG: hypothetical protein JXO51_07545 [Candidatus Aminicenantes bacterium]|nr:hypothetical protein [Candidatus Aminicenantes bacterium]